MTVLTNVFTTLAGNWKVGLMEGERGVRAFLRLHQHASYPEPALHIQDVRMLAASGHAIVGMTSPDNRLMAACIVLLPGLHMPSAARLKAVNAPQGCAALAFASVNRKNTAHYVPALAEQGLTKAACAIAQANGSACLLSGKTLWNTATFEKVEESAAVIISAEQNPVSAVRQSLTA